jgi:hypothetical protein
MLDCVSGKKNSRDRFIPIRSERKLFINKPINDSAMVPEDKSDTYDKLITKEMFCEPMID